jgi:16S rRNA (guanine527-N7)-methyltransferase
VERIELLSDALKAQGFSVSQEMIEKFSRYRALLLEWNKRVNLISRNDESRIVTRHFLESAGLISVVRFALGSRILDLGTGAGFPGIPMKIVRPDLTMVLVESKRKKVPFLRRVIEKLELDGIDVRLGRAEEIDDAMKPVDFVVSRSVTDLVTLLKWSRKFLTPNGGSVVVIKGSGVHAEMDRVQKSSAELNVKQSTVLKYDPFPDVFQRNESFVAVIEISAVH